MLVPNGTDWKQMGQKVLSFEEFVLQKQTKNP